MNCIIFIGKRNKTSLNEIKRIYHQLPDNYTVYWAYNSNEATYDINGADMAPYKTMPYIDDSLYLKTNKSFLNYSKILEYNYTKLLQYDYIFVTHSDVHYSGKYSTLFALLSTSNADFMAPSIKKYPTERCNSWMWINHYLDNKKYVVDPHIKYFVGAFTYSFRISKQALQFLVEYNTTDIKDSFYEFYMPTLLYNYGYSFQSYDKDESNSEFWGEFNVSTKNSFACGLSHTNESLKENMKTSKFDLLFNGFAQTRQNIVIDSIINKHNNVKNTIIVPVMHKYNNINNLLLSCVNIPDTELIVISEFEDDNLASFISSYNQSVIFKQQTGLADTLNIGLKYAEGEYIFIHIPDAMFNQSRLLNQINNLGGADILLSSSNIHTYGDVIVNKEMLLNESYSFTYDTLCMKSSVTNMSILFEEYFKDHIRKFLCTAIDNNMIIRTSSDIVATYPSKPQTNIISNDEFRKIYNCYHFKEDNPELTCILTFKNEKEEVEKTVQSIRAMSDNVAIMLINDASEDGTDYKKVADKYHCKYIEHKKSIGCGPSRDDGVAHCDTPYFILLDAHMRMYEFGWDTRLLSYIKRYDNSIICTNSTVLRKDNHSLYTNEDGIKGKATTYGASFNCNKDKLFDVTWANKPVAEIEPNFYEVACVLGATYCSSVKHWKNIGGLKGLYIYGLDEGLMSFKTWAIGGHCYILRNMYIGHIYRDASPFTNTVAILESNRIMCYKAFVNYMKVNDYLKQVKDRIGSSTYTEAEKLFSNKQVDVNNIKTCFVPKMKHNLEEFIKWNKSIYDL